MYALGEFLFDTEHSAACHSTLQDFIVVIAFVRTFAFLLRDMYLVSIDVSSWSLACVVHGGFLFGPPFSQVAQGSNVGVTHGNEFLAILAPITYWTQVAESQCDGRFVRSTLYRR